jgi:hypothetical protein
MGLTVDGLMAHTVALLGLPSTMAISPSDFSATFTTIAFDDSGLRRLAQPSYLLDDKWRFAPVSWRLAVRPWYAPRSSPARAEPSTFADRVDPAIRLSLTRGRDTFTYYAGMSRILEGSTPETLG